MLTDLWHSVMFLEIVLHGFSQQAGVRDLRQANWKGWGCFRLGEHFMFYLIVYFCFRLREHVVAKEKGAEMFVIDNRWPTLVWIWVIIGLRKLELTQHMREQNFAQVHFEKPLTLRLHHVKKLLSVLCVYEPILKLITQEQEREREQEREQEQEQEQVGLPVIKDPVDFMTPEANELVWVPEVRAWNQLDSFDHIWKVPAQIATRRGGSSKAITLPH